MDFVHVPGRPGTPNYRTGDPPRQDELTFVIYIVDELGGYILDEVGNYLIAGQFTGRRPGQNRTMANYTPGDMV